jgi:2-alkenal reductase
MSASRWLKVSGFVAALAAATLVGALLLPDLTTGDPPPASSGDAPTDGTPVPQEIKFDDRDVTDRQAIPIDQVGLADIVEDVSRSVVVVESHNGPGATSNRATSGSGFVIDREGHILTNFHVIDGLSTVKITFASGSATLGQVLGTDPSSDLAVVKVDAPTEWLYPVTFGDSDEIRRGDPVFAIGSPFSQRFSVTSGIVSATGRTTVSSFTGRSIRDVIQIDAAVNPGNSGGPLFNYQGEVIGINTSIENPNGRFFVGLGFAVPSNTATRHLPAMVAGETVAHPQLGVTVEPIDEVIADQLGLGVSRGVYVMRVQAGSAADRAGIVAASSTLGSMTAGGDVIVSLGGHPVRSFEELSRAIDLHDIGDEVVIVVNRNGNEVELSAQLQPWDVR